MKKFKKMTEAEFNELQTLLKTVRPFQLRKIEVTTRSNSVLNDIKKSDTFEAYKEMVSAKCARYKKQESVKTPELNEKDDSIIIQKLDKILKLLEEKKVIW